METIKILYAAFLGMIFGLSIIGIVRTIERAEQKTMVVNYMVDGKIYRGEEIKQVNGQWGMIFLTAENTN